MAVLGGNHLCEIEWKPVGVVQFERVFTGDDRLVSQLLHPRQSAFNRLEEPLLLRARDALEVLLFGEELGVHVAHHAADGACERRQRRLASAEEPGMTHAAAQNATQYVAAAFVRRIDAIGKQEGDGTGVVGENPVGSARGAAIVRPADDLYRVRDDRLEEIGIEIRRNILHDRRDSLEAGTCIHRRSGKRDAGCVGLLVVLHEHQIPNFQ